MLKFAFGTQSDYINPCHELFKNIHLIHGGRWYVVQAVGRIVGSLCVLSARVGDAESAMLASWVSQASFVPPGLTIAVSPALRDLIQLCKISLYPEIHIALLIM